MINYCSPRCNAVVYCSDSCRFEDFFNSRSPEHSHRIWCRFMKLFMDLPVHLCDFPFCYAGRSTNEGFSRSELHKFLQSNGVDNTGLWKYLLSTPGYGPGDDLYFWRGLMYGVRPGELNQGADASSDAYLRAYVIPECAEAMSTRRCSNEDSGNLFNVNLQSWSDFYNFVKIPYPLPLAFISHWPLTMYHILKIFSDRDQQAVQGIREKKSLLIHLLGVEKELDLLPVFKELDNLISPVIERISIKMIGPNISPRASYKTWLLTSRISVFVWRGVYHDFMRTHRENPDIAIGFNVGFIAYPTWKQTLELIKYLNLPAFFTDSCPYSCMWNLKTLQSLGLCSEFDINNAERSLSLVRMNPFRSPLRIQDEGTCWPKFSNAFIFSINI
ncbi:unnamed protein product [Hymenolepis diminuta]|uniref:Mitochondrial splicing suppressor 51-like C-terminal domain-containing protein n=1 Tax=Hymenolepis diminuta TaxID=6216 RepID=A0A3P7A2F6_HYMDI|nr:unnamed protein product [Hymenolepis diminuta]